MNTQNYTQKSLEAINGAQSLVTEYQNQTMEQQHVLLALLEQNDGLIPKLLVKMGTEIENVTQEARRAVNELPRVTGAAVREADKIYIASDVDRMLVEAEKISGSMRDEYVSTEHIFLALAA
ncbi:MAG: Clp protease N-terminal domain-containing protein, partial [Oscillospiraceae bacterium]